MKMQITILCQHLELIDTQWDVNKLVKPIKRKKYFELIDTQWDVNIFILMIITLTLLELIDTQWDVNINNINVYPKFSDRINRYIVGCK